MVHSTLELRGIKPHPVAKSRLYVDYSERFILL